ncbi:MAG: hypothetical protein ABIK39_06375 [candidate division WOR-3 bacterium]
MRGDNGANLWDGAGGDGGGNEGDDIAKDRGSHPPYDSRSVPGTVP